MRNQMDTFDVLGGIIDEMKRQGLDAIVEGGGAAIPFIEVKRKDGSIVLFGDLDETWGGQVYNSAEDLARGDYSDSRDAELSTENIDPKDVTAAFIKTFSN